MTQSDMQPSEETTAGAIRQSVGENVCQCGGELRLVSSHTRQADCYSIWTEDEDGTWHLTYQHPDCLRRQLAQAEERAEEVQETLTAVEHEVAKVYCELTNDRISKCNTKAEVVVAQARDIQEEHTQEYIQEVTANLQAENARLRRALAAAKCHPECSCPDCEEIQSALSSTSGGEVQAVIDAARRLKQQPFATTDLFSQLEPSLSELFEALERLDGEGADPNA